ncbi:uncharacterized protein [Elaeis guineensis]|uniref:Uncharacterized protein LOC105056536 n=1 Tax=Elaeis guineensis var. tenera TaxID=51953 RepID=A0A6I9S3M3_ELAGV|nr:uncharacterized protein LOC105056536 [Elaeis guineensis]
MDLNMTEVFLHGKESLMSGSVIQTAHISTCGKNDNLGDTALCLDCLGNGINNTNRTVHTQISCDLSSQDDGCKLVLGLGPTPNTYCADHHPSGIHKTRPSMSLLAQHSSGPDAAMLKLGLSGGNLETIVALPQNNHKTHSPPAKRSLPVPIVDEGSTSAKRRSGGYMPFLLFAPRLDSLDRMRIAPETRDLLDQGSGGSTRKHHIPHHQLQLSPEPSVTTDGSLGAISEAMIAAAATTDMRTHHQHPKKCRFTGCSKGARGASGLCIAHGGGQRCQKPGCNKGAESRTAYCKAHGGGRRCQQLGCTKSAEGKTDFCIGHGGGRRCVHPGCTKAARGKSGLCIRHGGGKRCTVEGCTRSAEGQAGLCISHGGGRRCQYPGCGKGAQGSTKFCKAHGGGRRCIFEGCTKGAEGSTPLCKGHGGGKRCLFEGGGVCPKSVHGGTNFCVAHGGGKRCTVPGCTKSARGRTDCCVRHGGGKRCKFDGCGKSAQGSTDFCKAHGGGKRCLWSQGCEKFARGRSGLCAAHGSLMLSPQECNAGKSGSMIGPGLFQGIVSTFTAAKSSINEHSSSGMSTISDSVESEESMGRKQLIPPQVLVPLSMKSPSPSSVLMDAGREEGGSHQDFGLVVPEGRVHGGGLMTLLGGDLKNAFDGGAI